MTNVPRLDAYHFYEQEWDDYDQLVDDFEWEVPDQFNIADYVCTRWADDPDRIALYADNEQGDQQTFTFREMDQYSNQLANYLTGHGIQEGARIGFSAPQKPETAITYLAAWKIGAIPVPLSTKFGADAIRYRLDDSGAMAMVVDEKSVDPFREAKPALNSLTIALTVGDIEREGDETAFWTALESESDVFESVDTSAEDGAVIIYTSGTTGNPKGVLHAQRFFLGHLPLFITDFCNMDLQQSELFWLPSEWSWIAVFDIIFPAWFYGRPALAYHSSRFTPETAFSLVERYGVTNAFIPPTALRMMKQVETPTTEYATDSLQVIASGGEALDASTFEWASDVFGDIAVHEGYGQTEANMLVANCSALADVRVGRMGLAGLGHTVRILDPETAEPTVPRGEVGEIGVRYEDDPVCFKEYWNRPTKTEEKVQNGWVLTEDLGRQSEDGYFSFVSRKDYVIISSGYRIGPEEIEESLCSHEAVAQAGVIAVPDEERGQVPKAFIELSDGYDPSEELISRLKQLVKDNLAKYEYPREIDVLETLPTTTTGKIERSKLEQRKETGD